MCGLVCRNRHNSEKLEAPDMDSEIRFWLIHKDIHQLSIDESEVIINSIVLGEEFDSAVRY